MKSARRTTATAVVLATAGTLVTLTTSPAAATVSCTSPVFKRQFYANTSFSGTPKKTDCDNAIDQSWTGAPVTGLPKDNFGVRWTLTRDFGSGGPFALNATGLDGIRVYLDGVRKIDLWKNVSSTVTKTANVTIPSGKHSLRIDYANWTGTAKVKVTYAPRTSADVDKVKPLTPTGTSVTYDKSTRKAKVSWAKNTEMDLAGYQVYRRLKGTSYGTKPLTTTTSTSYTDGPPPTGATYYYEVRARDKAGNTSRGTADQPVTTVDTTPPAAPFLEMDACPDNQPFAAPELVTTAENRADIAWYELQRLDPATNTWATVYAGAKGAICDTGQPADGSKVTYRGRARDAVGNWSAYSAATSFTTFDMTPPATVADARVEYRSGIPHLMWSAVDGAARYEVLQYDPATGGWLDALPGAAGTTTQTDVVPRQLAAVADSYRYAVRAQDTKGNASAPVEVTLTTADRPEAIAPFSTTATRFDEGVMIEWSSADPWTFGEDRPLLTYRITRTDKATGESSAVTGCKPNSSQDLPLTDPQTYWSWNTGDAPDYAGPRQINGVCWDVSGASETTYDYTIVTIDPYGHESQPGPAATATTPDTVRPAPVENLTAEQIPLGVRLTWTPPADDDVTGYKVWQGVTDPETGETQWKDNCWTGESLATTEILCPTVPDGATHTYKVAATDGSPLIPWYAGPEAYHPAELSVTLPDTRPPGWTGTEIREDQYPELYVGCSESSGLGDCGRFRSYRVERWDPASAAYVTLSEGTMYDAVYFMDKTVHEDTLGLYYYRVVRLDEAGAEAATTPMAYGIWDSWI
ncbi:PA14 domain-containing protein [Streptomyces sp. NRRL B-24085]|uniref:PA14 domain-containing protein n=1 Tax=Streptomyces sp. NRRL B-24085 TaxID=1709476 RepID=UPI0006B3354A|nr:PA14 domain-containing protein [Streptomyces sp. NRRL B-24085]